MKTSHLPALTGAGEASLLSGGSSRQFVAQGLLLFSALVAVFLAGGPHQGGMGVFLAAAGTVLLVIPMPRSVSWWIWVGAALLILALSLALLPAKCLGALEEWKTFLRGVPAVIPGFSDPVQISANPKETLFWILLLAGSILTGIYSLGSPLAPGYLKQMALLACFGCSLYAIVAMISWRTGWHYPFFIKDSWSQPAFGFFPNRNHTAGFLLTGDILALGLMRCAICGGRPFFALLAASFFVLLTGTLLFFSISRGGLLFLLVGVVIWMIGLGRYRSRSLLIFSGILFVVMLTLFLQSGSGLMERFQGGGGGTVAAACASTEGTMRRKPPVTGRVAIALDTLPMIAGHPVAGVGLGGYAGAYPFYADKSLSDHARALHAESDWLTFCAEGGIPSLILAMVLLGILSARIPGLRIRSGREWPVRWAFLSAFIAELLHGLCDVPLHRPELGWWILLLGGIGFSGDPRVEKTHQHHSTPSRSLQVQRAILMVGALGMIFLGGLLILAEWGGRPSLPPFAVEKVRARLLKLSFKGDEPSTREAIDECRRAISDHPLEHLLYYQLALLSLQLTKGTQPTESLFEVERRLSPNDPSFVFEQGKVLADLDPDATAALWKESLRRQLFLDHRPNSPIPRSESLCSSMIFTAQGHPALFSHLPALVADTTPELRMLWYSRPECDSSLIVRALHDPSFMEQLDAKQQGRLIGLWWEHHPERKDLEEFLRQHPEYARAASATTASLLASSGQTKAACQLLVERFHLQIPTMDVPVIHAADQEVPNDPLAAARYYLERGNTTAAHRLLEEALRLPGGVNNEAQALFLNAVLEMRAENWNEALGSLLRYLRSTGQI